MTEKRELDEAGAADRRHSPHVQRDPRLVRHPALVPGRVEDHVDRHVLHARAPSRPRSPPSPASRRRPGSRGPSASCRWRRCGRRRSRPGRSGRARRCRTGSPGRRRSSAPRRCRRSGGRARPAGCAEPSRPRGVRAAASSGFASVTDLGLSVRRLIQECRLTRTASPSSAGPRRAYRPPRACCRGRTTRGRWR